MSFFVQSTTFKLPKKGVLFAHLNVCSLRNKIHEISNLAELNDIHIFALSETHLDSTFSVSEIAIQGYNLFRKGRNKHGREGCYLHPETYSSNNT